LRRNDRELVTEDALALLDGAEYGILSTVSKDGAPYGVPLSFCVMDGSIYFHCALEGRKLENLEHNRAVSFCVVGNTRVLPEKFGTLYESAVASGEAIEVFDEDKQRALEGLVRKYAADFIESGAKYIDGLRHKTRVYRIVVSSVTGKARRA